MTSWQTWNKNNDWGGSNKNSWSSGKGNSGWKSDWNSNRGTSWNSGWKSDWNSNSNRSSWNKGWENNNTSSYGKKSWSSGWDAPAVVDAAPKGGAGKDKGAGKGASKGVKGKGKGEGKGGKDAFAAGFAWAQAQLGKGKGKGKGKDASASLSWSKDAKGKGKGKGKGAAGKGAKGKGKDSAYSYNYKAASWGYAAGTNGGYGGYSNASTAASSPTGAGVAAAAAGYREYQSAPNMYGPWARDTDPANDYFMAAYAGAPWGTPFYPAQRQTNPQQDLVMQMTMQLQAQQQQEQQQQMMQQLMPPSPTSDMGPMQRSVSQGSTTLGPSKYDVRTSGLDTKNTANASSSGEKKWSKKEWAIWRAGTPKRSTPSSPTGTSTTAGGMSGLYQPILSPSHSKVSTGSGEDKFASLTKKALKNPEKYRDPTELAKLKKHQKLQDKLRANQLKVDQDVAEHYLWVRSPTSGQMKSVDQLLQECRELLVNETALWLQKPEKHREPAEMKELKLHEQQQMKQRAMKAKLKERLNDYLTWVGSPSTAHLKPVDDLLKEARQMWEELNVVDEDAPTSVLIAGTGVKQLGMCFEINTVDPEGPMVSVVEVTANGWSARRGLRKGHEITKLNGSPVEKLPNEVILQLMRGIRPLKMEISNVWDYLEARGGRT